MLLERAPNYLKTILGVAVALTILIASLLLAGFLSGKVRNHIDDRKEKVLLASLRVGMSRQQFYARARQIGIKSVNGKAVWHDTANPPGTVATAQDKVGHGYVPLSKADFPVPDQKDRHPQVEFTFDKVGGFCTWPFDEIKVYFNHKDAISRWTLETYQTGC